jgi:hypothetical protein
MLLNLRRRARTLLALTVALCLGGVLFGGPGAHAATALLNVFVSNDAAHPVPVRQQGTVAVQQQGTASVRDELAPGATATRTDTHTSPQQNSPEVITPTVPAGKKFIIQSISAMMVSNSSGFDLTAGYCLLRLVPPGGEFGGFFATLVGEMSGHENVWAANEQTFIPLLAGEKLEIQCRYAGGVYPSTELDVSVGGYFVPAS